jgi:hypothetical protein
MTCPSQKEDVTDTKVKHIEDRRTLGNSDFVHGPGDEFLVQGL